MYLVLDEEIDQWHQGTKEQTGHDFPILRSTAVVTTQGDATQRPRQSCNQVRNHKDIVPVMVISRCYIGPTTTGECPKQSDTSNYLWQSRVGPRSKDIPEEHQSESRAGSDGDEDLEEGTFGVSITNGCGYGREPFIGVAVMFVLDDFREMQRHSHD